MIAPNWGGVHVCIEGPNRLVVVGRVVTCTLPHLVRLMDVIVYSPQGDVVMTRAAHEVVHDLERPPNAAFYIHKWASDKIAHSERSIVELRTSLRVEEMNLDFLRRVADQIKEPTP